MADHPEAWHDVFYVEDAPVNVLLMQALFEQRPLWRLHVATTCQQARQQIAALQPALLLLDVCLPDGDGRALLHELRQLPCCWWVPAVAVTAESTFTTDGSSFDEVWTKPLEMDRVMQRLDHWLGACRSPLVARRAVMTR